MGFPTLMMSPALGERFAAKKPPDVALLFCFCNAQRPCALNLEHME